jgi:hypothetical protein
MALLFAQKIKENKKIDLETLEIEALVLTYGEKKTFARISKE